MRRLLRAAAQLLLVVIAASVLFGCKKDVKKRVYGHCELTLDLPPRFSDYDSGDTYDAAYSDGEVLVGFLRLSFDVCRTEGIPTTMSPRAFADHYYRTVALEGIEVGETRSDGDVVYYTYELSTESGKGYTYMPTFYFTPYAYFIVTYVVPSEIFEEKQATLIGYAKSFKIVDN